LELIREKKEGVISEKEIIREGLDKGGLKGGKIRREVEVGGDIMGREGGRRCEEIF
jgi:hypothetical protein